MNIKQFFCWHNNYKRPYKDSNDYDKFRIKICIDCGKKHV